MYSLCLCVILSIVRRRCSSTPSVRISCTLKHTIVLVFHRSQLHTQKENKTNSKKLAAAEFSFSYLVLLLIISRYLFIFCSVFFFFFYLRPVSGCINAGCEAVVAVLGCGLGLLTFVLLLANSKRIVWGISGSKRTPCCK